MRKFVIVTLPAVAALGVAAPAVAQHKAAPARPTYHRSALEAALTARLQSIQTRIELLREEGLMGSEEARSLQQESRSIEQRLSGLNARDVSDVELLPAPRSFLPLTCCPDCRGYGRASGRTSTRGRRFLDLVPRNVAMLVDFPRASSRRDLTLSKWSRMDSCRLPLYRGGRRCRRIC